MGLLGEPLEVFPMKSLGFVALCLVLTTTMAMSGVEQKSDVTVVNKSDWDIHHFFLSPAEQNEWGPDQLGDEVIGTGDSFRLTGVPCDEFDVRLVDEDGDECVVLGVDICGSSEQWEIESSDLLECQAN
jgi:hypothetical protein